MKRRWLIVLMLCATGLIAGFSISSPLLKVAAGFSAKTVCSGVFVSGREERTVLNNDVRANGHPVLQFVNVVTDYQNSAVNASVVMLPWTGVSAVYRKDNGCTLLPDGTTVATLPQQPAGSTVSDTALWPSGDKVAPVGADNLQSLIAAASDIEGTRALVVVHKGAIIAEYYAPDISSATPLIGWSLTKTVVSMLVGLAVQDGLLSLDENNLFAEWNGDERREITVRHLLHMESGLVFDESSDGLSDATRMLFLEPDMAEFAVRRPLVHTPGTEFHYSSGNTHLLVRLLTERMTEQMQLQDYFYERLLNPLGAHRSTFERDAVGNYVGSAFLYAVARDWAKFGELLKSNGRWGEQQLLSPDWIKFMREPSPQSDGDYGAHVWLRGQGGDRGFDLPSDAVWFLGFDGQSIAVLPSHELVVVRLGLTPGEHSFKPQRLVQGLVHSLKNN